MIALGVVAARLAVRPPIRGARRRHAPTTRVRSRSGRCSPASIGARLYHVATDWERFANNYADIPKIWEGGLGIPGGLLLGIPVGLYMAKRAGHPARRPQPPAPRPPSRWRRRSVGGATTSTRSCTAGRPICRGRSRSTPTTWSRTRPPASCSPSGRRSTRRSSTNRCGASRPCSCCCTSTVGGGRAAAR